MIDKIKLVRILGSSFFHVELLFSVTNETFLTTAGSDQCAESPKEACYD